jgi:transcriptional regulator with XRE-family HTH domain
MPRDETLIKKIMNRIEHLKKERGVTYLDIFHDTGIHLGRIISQKRDIPISTLSDICKYFGMSLSEFFKGI